MKKVIFSKFSNERKEEFQIVTSIVSEDGKKEVLKRNLKPQGRSHIKRVVRNYEILKEGYYLDKAVYVAPCRQTAEDEVSFEFVEGSGMDQIITGHIKNNDMDSVIADIRKFADIAENLGTIAAFELTEEFKGIFGNPKLPANLKAASVSNVDMLFSNVIRNDRYNVVDYEWVFDFPIPVNYIIYRSILLHGQINLLPDEAKEKIYTTLGISSAERAAYLEMEMKFQIYVSGANNSLRTLYDTMAIKNYTLDKMNLEKVFFTAEIHVEKDGNRKLVDRRQLYLNDIEFKVDLREFRDCERIIVKPVDTRCIIKLQEIKADKDGMEAKLVPAESNEDLLIIDDYYFASQAPCVIYDNAGYAGISLRYQVIKRDDTGIRQQVGFLKDNHSLKCNLEKTQGELDAMKNTRVWRTYLKIVKIKKRFMRK